MVRPSRLLLTLEDGVFVFTLRRNPTVGALKEPRSPDQTHTHLPWGMALGSTGFIFLLQCNNAQPTHLPRQRNWKMWILLLCLAESLDCVSTIPTIPWKFYHHFPNWRKNGCPFLFACIICMRRCVCFFFVFISYYNMCCVFFFCFLLHWIYYFLLHCSTPFFHVSVELFC